MPYADPTSEAAKTNNAEKSKRWRERHPEQWKQIQKDNKDRYYAENGEAVRAKQSARLAAETPEQRETRLAKMRERAAERRKDPEQKAKALQAMRDWRAQNPERAREQSRDQQRRQREAMADHPRPSNCECCGKPGGDAKPNLLHWDHDHVLEKLLGRKVFRGWICQKCNTIIGQCDDSQEHLQKCIDYLRRTLLDNPHTPAE